MDPKRRAPIREMHWTFRELINEIVGFGGLSKKPPIPWSDVWCDQGATHECWPYNRYFFASYTPGGVHCIFQAFEWRMAVPATGESKRKIKRDIQSNPHLHPKLKRFLLRKLAKVSVRTAGRGIRDFDSTIARRIQAMKTHVEAFDIEREIRANIVIPEAMRENLLYNLANYRGNLDASLAV